MKKILLTTLILYTTLSAQINVATTYSYLGAVTKRIGGALVKVDVLANPRLDPHFITPKPSLLGKLRREDLIIINGGQLEIGWLPPLLKRANNKKILPGGRGFLDVSGAVSMIDKPKNISRAYGDIHPDGNPHFALDIHNIIPIAKLISMKLSQIDSSHSATYRKNFLTFKSQMQSLIKKLRSQTKGCRGKKVIQYHELFNYALKSYGVKSMGNIEPLPGITPSSKHTVAIINLMKKNGIKRVLQDVYHEKKTARFIAKKAGATVRVVPHDVGSMPHTGSLEKFYTKVVQQICR